MWLDFKLEPRKYKNQFWPNQWFRGFNSQWNQTYNGFKNRVILTLTSNNGLFEKKHCSNVNWRQRGSRPMVTKLGKLYTHLKVTTRGVIWCHFHPSWLMKIEKSSFKVASLSVFLIGEFSDEPLLSKGWVMLVESWERPQGRPHARKRPRWRQVGD